MSHITGPLLYLIFFYLSFPAPLPSVSPCPQAGQNRRSASAAFPSSLLRAGPAAEAGGGGVQGSSRRPVGGRAPGRAGMSHPALDGEQQRRAWVGSRRKLCVQKTWQDISPPPVWGMPENGGMAGGRCQTPSLQRRRLWGPMAIFPGVTTELEEGDRDFVLGPQMCVLYTLPVGSPQAKVAPRAPLHSTHTL